jgi:hypothetical protein
MDLDVGKYTTTQEIFLSKVGIGNSYSEDTQVQVEPFFVRMIHHHEFCLLAGKTRHPVCVYQTELALLCVHEQAAVNDTRLRSRSTHQTDPGINCPSKELKLFDCR